MVNVLAGITGDVQNLKMQRIGNEKHRGLCQAFMCAHNQAINPRPKRILYNNLNRVDPRVERPKSGLAIIVMHGEDRVTVNCGNA